MATNKAPLKKYQQINKTQKTMFIWVAITSALIGFAGVADYFIIHKAIFMHKVVSEKHKTISNLKNNNAATRELIENVKLLETNEALNSTKTNGDAKAIQSVLDALPVEPNEQALGASLQSSLLINVDGVNLENLTILPAITDASSSSSSNNQDAQNRINFSFTLRADNATGVMDILSRLESSIRVIQVDSLKINISRHNTNSAEAQKQEAFEMKVEAHAYYKPAQKIELKNKEVRP